MAWAIALKRQREDWAGSEEGPPLANDEAAEVGVVRRDAEEEADTAVLGGSNAAAQMGFFHCVPGEGGSGFGPSEGTGDAMDQRAGGEGTPLPTSTPASPRRHKTRSWIGVMGDGCAVGLEWSDINGDRQPSAFSQFIEDIFSRVGSGETLAVLARTRRHLPRESTPILTPRRRKNGS